MAPDEVSVRYVPPRLVDNDLVDGAAFQLRPVDEGELSIYLIGADDSFHGFRLSEVRASTRLAVRRNGRFAEIAVQSIRAAFEGEAPLHPADVIHDPLEAEGDWCADENHAVVVYLPAAGTEEAVLAGDLLAARISKVHAAID